MLLLLDLLFAPPTAKGRASTIITSSSGYPLRAFADADGSWQYPTTPDQLSPLYLEALLNYEDRWFYQHPGVNPFAIVRALWQNIAAGKVISGGSTITMQTARLLEPHPRTVFGKLRQILRALQLEWYFSKKAILTLYINNAPFGGPLQGVEAASHAYLGKSAKELSHAEAAMLAVLPQAPSRLRPDRHPQKSKKARDKVLHRLQKNGIWSQEVVHQALMEPIIVDYQPQPFLAPLLARRLYNRPATTRGGVTRSSIDENLQWSVERKLTSYLSRFGEGSSAAVLIVENSSLLVLAYAGSADFHDLPSRGQVDMVTAIRSPGSTLKPFLYGLALEEGLIHSQSLLSDTPQVFKGYRPENFDLKFLGPLSAKEALTRSRNVPAVDLLMRITPQRFSARLRQGGLNIRLPRGSSPNPAIILGGAGTSLEKLTSVYAALARGGKSGNLRLTPQTPLEERRLLTAGAAWIVRRMLADRRPDLTDWEGIAVAQERRLAWKTGTSYGFRDAWAMGVSEHYTVGVWVGRPDGTPAPGQLGAITALPLLLDLADGLPRSQSRENRDPQPASVSAATICWPLGTIAETAADNLCQERRKAWILNGIVPPTLPDEEHWQPLLFRFAIDMESGKRVGKTGCDSRKQKTVQIARWPRRLQPWLSTTRKKRSQLPAWACPQEQGKVAPLPLKLSGIKDGDLLHRAGSTGENPTINLSSDGGEGSRYWLVNEQLKKIGESFTLQLPHPGLYTITLLDEIGGFDKVTISMAE